VRLPINKVNTYNKLNAAVTNFNQQFEREPSEAELADLLDIKVEEVAKMMSGGRRHLSTDAEIGDMYGLTRERVRQIRERAIRRLRKSVNKNALKSYLG